MERSKGAVVDARKMSEAQGLTADGLAAALREDLEKVTLFRSLFRGREDVYPTVMRWHATLRATAAGAGSYEEECQADRGLLCRDLGP